ncbi:MAG: hypothetical protein WBD73_00920, partial [Candidatus Acidiferrales bacterium]
MRFANKSKFALLPFILCFCLATLASAPPQAQQSPAPAPAAPFQFAFSGNVAQVPVEVSGHLVLVPIRVNGAQPSWFLLDTTRPTSSLDDVRAVALGLLPPGSAGSKSLSSVVLDFPSLKVSTPSLALDSLGDLSSRVGRAIQGILGADVLSHFVVVISYDRQTLQFYDPKSFQYKGAGVKLKMQTPEGVPALDVKFSLRHRGMLHGLFSIATAQAEAMQFAPSFS